MSEVEQVIDFKIEGEYPADTINVWITEKGEKLSYPPEIGLFLKGIDFEKPRGEWKTENVVYKWKLNINKLTESEKDKLVILYGSFTHITHESKIDWYLPLEVYQSDKERKSITAYFEKNVSKLREVIGEANAKAERQDTVIHLFLDTVRGTIETTSQYGPNVELEVDKLE
jgi:hypothetical protein